MCNLLDENNTMILWISRFYKTRILKIQIKHNYKCEHPSRRWCIFVYKREKKTKQNKAFSTPWEGYSNPIGLRKHHSEVIEGQVIRQ